MRWLIALAIVTVTTVTHAEVYRCEKDGKVIYTDQPCNAGAQPHDLPEAIVVQPPSKSERDLAKQHDARLQRDKSTRDKSDAKWLKEHQHKKDRAERVRAAIIRHDVIKGMTAAEVRSALGDPDKVVRSESDGSPKETWTYSDDAGSRTVNFKNDEVSGSSKRKKGTKK